MVTVANVHDSKATLLLMRILKYYLSSVKVILADAAYRGEIIEQIKRRFSYEIQVVTDLIKTKIALRRFIKDGL